MPLQGSFRISKALSDVAQQYSNFEYVFASALPDKMVKEESGQYYIYNNDLRIPGNTLRANGAPAHEVTFDMSTSTYNVREHGVQTLITDRDYDNTDSPPIMLDRDNTEYLADKLMLKQEMEAMQLMFTTTSFGNSKTLTSETTWKYHTTTSLPIQDMLSATSYILQYAGAKSNVALMGISVRNSLKENPNVYGRIQYVQKAIITEDLLASLFELESVKVGSAVYETAKEGISSDKGAIWSDTCWVGYLESNPGIKTKTAALNFRKNNSGTPIRIDSWRDDNRSGKWLRATTFFKGKVISSVSGYLFSNCAI